jgi:hypothetical protein
LSSAQRGSFSFNHTRNGVATTTEENVPIAMPTNSARARSLSVPAPSTVAPMNSRDATGRIDVIAVDSDRTSTSLSARLAVSP